MQVRRKRILHHSTGKPLGGKDVADAVVAMRAVQLAEQAKSAKRKMKEAKKKLESKKKTKVRVGDLGIPIDEPEERPSVRVGDLGIPIDDAPGDDTQTNSQATDTGNLSRPDTVPVEIEKPVKRKSLGSLDGEKPAKRKSIRSAHIKKKPTQVSPETEGTAMTGDMNQARVQDEASIMLDSIADSDDEEGSDASPGPIDDLNTILAMLQHELGEGWQ